jgi:hypothetical protein
LAGKTFPDSGDTLASAIQGALAQVLTMPTKGSAVSVQGGKFPKVKKLSIDLSGASVSAAEPPPKPKATGKREPGIEVDQLEVLGQPIKYEQNKLDLSLNASGVRFDYGRDKKGQPLLVLADARDGHVEAKISKADIEALARAAAELAGKQHGIKIEGLELTLTSQGSRSIAADVRVKAKKMMVSGVLHIKGKLDVDDELNATVSDLNATGEGMIGTMAAGILQGKLKPYNGKVFPLMTFSLGDVALKDLKIDVKTNVKVSADFGSSA